MAHISNYWSIEFEREYKKNMTNYWHRLFLKKIKIKLPKISSFRNDNTTHTFMELNKLNYPNLVSETLPSHLMQSNPRPNRNKVVFQESKLQKAIV